MNNFKLTKKEIKIILLLSLICIIIISLPFAYGQLIKGEGNFFSGFNFLSPHDGYVYYSYIEQIKQGHILIDDLSSGENYPALMFNPFWLLLGFFAEIFSLSSVWAIFLFKIIFIPIFILVIYKFLKYFLPEDLKKYANWCSVYALFVSGFGYYFIKISLLFATKSQLVNNYGVLPLDLWNQETNNFLALLGFPHIMASIVLLLLIFYYFFISIERNNKKLAVLAGFFTLLLASFHPYHIVTIYFISLVYLVFLIIIQKSNVKFLINYFLLVFVSAPSVIYYLLLITLNWQFQMKNLQNLLFSPSLLISVVSFGFVLIAAFLGLIASWSKKNDNKTIFLTIWIISGFILIYSPLTFQRRLNEGLIFPLIIFSFIFLAKIYKLLKAKITINFILQPVFYTILFILFILPNLFIYYENFLFLNYFRFDEGDEVAIFLDQETIAAVDWYKNDALYSDLILTSLYSGNYLAGLAGKKVYLAHEIETINYSSKKELVNWFFEKNNEDELKKEFLRNNYISYLYYSEQEKKLGDFQPSQKDYLQPVFENSEVQIYQVNLN